MVCRIVVLNPKGGSGKSTIACNLASACAAAGYHPALIDQDRQGSATHWLSQRAGTLPRIHGVAAYCNTPANVTRSYAMRLPADTDLVVVDTAAALTRHQLAEAARNADKIIVPILPSDTDMYAASQCISDLLVYAKIPRDRDVLGVVANRVRRNTATRTALLRFLESLGLPVIAELKDVQAYPKAAISGQGVCDLKTTDARGERRQWHALMNWIDRDLLPPPRRSEDTVKTIQAASPGKSKRKAGRAGLKVVHRS